MSALQITWFLLVGLLLTVYAVLDGFDLGAGFWHLFVKDEGERRALLSSIGPVWDGNEVWLVTGGGAIFAAFPPVYASVFSAFYLALMLLLLALIFRAVSLEFRSKLESPRWRGLWDKAFGGASSLAALLLGVALGNIMRGLPLDADGNYTGTFVDLLNPYSLLIGIVGFTMLATHAAIYLQLRTGGELGARARRWARQAWIAWMVTTGAAAFATVAGRADLLVNFEYAPVLWGVPVLTLAAMAACGVFVFKNRPGLAFVGSSLSIAGLMGLVGAALFPNLVPALHVSGHSLTLFNSSSSQLTLTSMLILALIGMPLVIGYTVWIYRAFAGKVEPADMY